MRSAIAVVLAVLSVTLHSAQEPSFEVASVKVTAKDEANPSGWATFRPGQVTIHASPLQRFLPTAFGVPIQLATLKFDVSRVSRDLLERTYFDIQAKGSLTGDQTAMMRTLLRERFGLKWHNEVRTVPVYTLTVKETGKLGPWLKPSAVNCRELLSKDPSAAVPECRSTGVMRDGNIPQRSAGTSADLVVRLQGFSNLPIIDATGLRGNYSWDFAMPWMSLSRPESAVTLRDAVDEQLGLKLTRGTGPWEVIVIDDVRMPTPN